ncbi:MAG: VOC family protein [Acidobacteriaceae bacterium]
MSETAANSKEKRPTLTPMLSVRNGPRAADFYQAAFGAAVLFRIDEGGTIALFSVAGAEFWIAEESPQNQNFSPETLNGSTVRLILAVDDPDAVFARALAAGATQVWPVEDKSYGWRVGRLADPFGHNWEIGKPLK